MEKLIKALAITAVATIGAALALHHLDGRRSRVEQDALGAPEEVDADTLSPQEREAMVAELEKQL